MARSFATMRPAILRLACAGLMLAAGARATVAGGIELELLVPAGTVDGNRFLGLAEAPDGSGRLFLVRQLGDILILDGDTLRPTPFLDLSDRVLCCDAEQGLLGLAFHPGYADNGRLFVTYNDIATGDSVLSRFTVSADPDRADAGSEVEILRVPKEEPVHNVGHLAFGADGLLYVGAGDGGVEENSQDLGSLQGKILRLDVDGGSTYSVPEDNPFAGDAGARGEIWAWGLRNPWRFSFDRVTGDLYIGDVGGAAFEEVDLEPAGGPGGINYGWPEMEGASCRDGGGDCNADGALTLPIIDYGHVSDNCNSITGGFRYRGPEVPTLPGLYVFGDFCRGTIWGARRNLAGNWVVNLLRGTQLRPASFGEDSSGRLYVVDFRGGLHRIAGRYLLASDFESGDSSDWSRRRGQLPVVSPGLKGSDFALEVPLAGESRRRFLRSNHPAREATFQASFLLRLDGARLTETEVEILRLAVRNGPGHTRLTLSREEGADGLNLLVRGADGGYVRRGRVGLPAKRAVRIGLEWLRASGADRDDGEITVRKNGRARIRVADLRNDREVVGTVWLGLPSGAGGTLGGGLRIDDYRSTP